MDILEAIERVSKSIEALSNEVRDLKSLASGASPSGPYSLHAECAPDDQVKIVLSYLAMNPGMEKDEMLNTLLTCAMNVVRAEGAGLCLYDDKKDVLVFRAAVGIAADQIIGFEVPLTNSQHGIAFRMRQVISSTPMNRAIDATTGEHYRNVLIAPLIVNNEAIGTLSAVNKKTEDQFTPQDIEDYTGFAEVAAHIIRQRLREYNLKQIIEGEAAKIPVELSGVKSLTDDLDLLEIIKNIVTIGSRSPEMVPLCRQLIGALANMD
ncbi:MAG: GAF domain-containing protein [Syntrophobacteraceae bacterium]|jgi:transcriptional regulator with GAF, ATPase, and Fis domain